ncbi:hypothetical protein NC653_039289 [Populus alba x Populus x berolinensis]|uniref:Secreted protein n=1 Tax=Populus alba x Populus x berolinensis TaxID=444605 RepID=A0AAD6LB43_9ROSI|nr:hypothetical protein NC653_039289 [Populus alba x Populus x berolinensis]
MVLLLLFLMGSQQLFSSTTCMLLLVLASFHFPFTISPCCLVSFHSNIIKIPTHEIDKDISPLSQRKCHNHPIRVGVLVYEFSTKIIKQNLFFLASAASLLVTTLLEN